MMTPAENSHFPFNGNQNLSGMRLDGLLKQETRKIIVDISMFIKNVQLLHMKKELQKSLRGKAGEDYVWDRIAKRPANGR